MANEVDVWTQSKPLGAFSGLVPQDESLGGGIGSSYGVIGYRGKTWSLRSGGQTHLWLRPEDGSPLNFLDVVILRASEVKSKSYYEGWDDEGSAGKRPICASMDGVRPDRDVQTKQSDMCALCPRNQWYTNDKGKKTKDCADYKRLAVLVLPQLTAPFFGGTALLEPVFLRIPGGSLLDLKTFGDQKANEGWHYSAYITRIAFDVRESYPKFVYTAQAPIRDENFAKIVMELRDDAVAKRITGEEGTGSGGMREVSGAGGQYEPAAQPPHPSTVQRAQPVQASPVPPTRDVIDLAPAADGSYSVDGANLLPAHFTRDTRVANDNVSGPAPAGPSAVHAVGQTAADVGTSVDDPAMEALLAGLLET